MCPGILTRYYIYQFLYNVSMNDYRLVIIVSIMAQSSSNSSNIITERIFLKVEENFIEFVQFFGFLLLDIGVVIASFLLWKFFWKDIGRLSIWDLKRGENLPVSNRTTVYRIWKSLNRLVKSLTFSDNYILNTCGFEAFTYLFFLRRFAHLMAMFVLTDLCIWIPYMAYFSKEFSLKSMESGSQHANFRTFYTLWITMATIYGMMSMKKYLRLLLKHRLFRKPSRDNKLLNNLKSKTIHIRFIGKNEPINEINIRTKLIEDLKIEDRIIAVLRLENLTEEIRLEYKYELYKTIKELGVGSFSKLWNFIKGEETDNLEEKLLQKKRELQHPMHFMYKNENYSNSYLVVFENYETVQNLTEEFHANRAVWDICPSLTDASQVEQHFKEQDVRIIARWAQEPQDVMWVNVGTPYISQRNKYILFNLLSFFLIIAGFGFIVIMKSKKIFSLPKVLGPLLVSLTNSILRFLISKSSEWENRLFQYQLQMKQMKLLTIFFFINVVIGAIVRDAYNLVDILKSGWGWLELIGLLNKKPDGLFYDLFIINEIALSVFSCLIRLGDIFIEVFNVPFTYEKNTRVRHKSKYGTNDPFRYGYSYSLDIVVLAIIIMYSNINPAIHFFGFLYFMVRLYEGTYTLTVLHKYEETCSNLRLITTVCEYIQKILLISIVLMGITMMFEKQFPNVIILYIFSGIILWVDYAYDNQATSLKDNFTDEQLKKIDLTNVVQMWKDTYNKSMAVDLQGMEI